MVNRIHSHVLEKIMGVLMTIFGVSAVYIFVQSVRLEGVLAQDLAVVEILLIIVLAILAQTVVLIRVYDNTLGKE